nr:hypothetical protein [Propioniciclava flava]
MFQQHPLKAQRDAGHQQRPEIGRQRHDVGTVSSKVQRGRHRQENDRSKPQELHPHDVAGVARGLRQDEVVGSPKHPDDHETQQCCDQADDVPGKELRRILGLDRVIHQRQHDEGDRDRDDGVTEGNQPLQSGLVPLHLGLVVGAEQRNPLPSPAH